LHHSLNQSDANDRGMIVYGYKFRPVMQG